MENLDCYQIKIFINLEIIGEEDKNKILNQFFSNKKIWTNNIAIFCFL